MGNHPKQDCTVKPAAAQGSAMIYAKQCFMKRLYPAPGGVQERKAPLRSPNKFKALYTSACLWLWESCRQGRFRDLLFFPGRE